MKGVWVTLEFCGGEKVWTSRPYGPLSTLFGMVEFFSYLGKHLGLVFNVRTYGGVGGEGGKRGGSFFLIGGLGSGGGGGGLECMDMDIERNVFKKEECVSVLLLCVHGI